MDDEALTQLLRDADAAAPAPAPPANLPQRVRALHQRRRRNRTIAAGGIAALVAATTLATFHETRPTPTPAGPPLAASHPTDNDELAQLRREIEQLRVETEAQLAALDELLAEQRREYRIRLLAAELAEPDPIEEIDKQLEHAAFIIVYQADRMYNKLGLPEPAIESYEDAVRLFPQTRAAARARAALARIHKQKGTKI